MAITFKTQCAGSVCGTRFVYTTENSCSDKAIVSMRTVNSALAGFAILKRLIAGLAGHVPERSSGE